MRDTQGYNSLHLARYDAFWLAADPSLSAGSYFNVIFRPQAYASAQARLLNVRYVLAASPLDVVEQRQADVAAVELAGHAVGQTFEAPEGLRSLAVAFDTLGRANHAPVTLHVRRALTDTQDLVTQTVDPSAWTGRPWITFAFPALDTPAGHAAGVHAGGAGPARRDAGAAAVERRQLRRRRARPRRRGPAL